MNGGPEHIVLRDIAPQPWKNGAGLTRELAVSPVGATTADFDWRLSVADVTRDAPFSVFPGIDRHIALLHGAGMLLRFLHSTHRLDVPLEPFRFSGDESLSAELIDGPTVDFNVMVRRDRCRARVDSGKQVDVPAATAGLLLCWAGTGEVHGADDRAATRTLGPGEALLWRHRMPALRARITTASGGLLLVRLDALCQDRPR